jgi:hypothetical protein
MLNRGIHTRSSAVLALASCGSAAVHHTAAARQSAIPTTVMDPRGIPCVSLDSKGYCPGDDPPTATPSPTPSPTPQAFFTDSGSGSATTPNFTVPDPLGNGGDWTLYYTYNCSGFGQAGNFQVLEDGGFNGAVVNELGRGRSASTFVVADSGPH